MVVAVFPASTVLVTLSCHRYMLGSYTHPPKEGILRVIPDDSKPEGFDQIRAYRYPGFGHVLQKFYQMHDCKYCAYIGWHQRTRNRMCRAMQGPQDLDVEVVEKVLPSAVTEDRVLRCRAPHQ